MFWVIIRLTYKTLHIGLRKLPRSLLWIYIVQKTFEQIAINMVLLVFTVVSSTNTTLGNAFDLRNQTRTTPSFSSWCGNYSLTYFVLRSVNPCPDDIFKLSISENLSERFINFVLNDKYFLPNLSNYTWKFKTDRKVEKTNCLSCCVPPYNSFPITSESLLKKPMYNINYNDFLCRPTFLLSKES